MRRFHLLGWWSLLLTTESRLINCSKLQVEQRAIASSFNCTVLNILWRHFVISKSTGNGKPCAICSNCPSKVIIKKGGSPYHLPFTNLIIFLSDPSVRDTCERLWNGTQCRSAEVKYYYDAVAQQCLPVKLQGCLANQNVFPTRALCDNTCKTGKGILSRALGAWERVCRR